ncbi:MAG: hypothetical protein KDK04_31180, partial [Candidatus Competibacteraceae bacterium]|nr:hypothetical protein [Candidatus Competibacteraceae bacterium]
MLLPPIKNYAAFCLSVILLFSVGSFSVRAASGPVISTGAEHACAVLNDSSIRCWGLNLSGQSSPPTGSFSQVSSGGYFTCGLRTNGNITCWDSLQLV